MSAALEAELLVHLDAQIASAQRLLGYVLQQGKAIRARDVDAVLARLTEIQTEMGRRGSQAGSTRSGDPRCGHRLPGRLQNRSTTSPRQDARPRRAG